MNLAIRGIDANLGKEWGDSFHNDQHKDLKADYVLANPPFNDSDWGGARLKDDVRWKLGVPPVGNANFAWVQHFVRPFEDINRRIIALKRESRTLAEIRDTLLPRILSGELLIPDAERFAAKG